MVPCREALMGPGRHPMALQERLFLNPFEKWSRHGRFPMAFVMHLLLVVLVSSQVLYYVSRDVDHISRTVRHVHSLFLGVRDDEIQVSKAADLQNTFSNAVHNFFFVNNVSLVHYDFQDADKLPITIRHRNGTMHWVKLLAKEYEEQRVAYLRRALPDLYNNNLQSIESVSLSYRFEENTTEGVVYTWEFEQKFDGKVLGEFKGTLGYVVGTRGSDSEGPWLSRGATAIVHGAANISVIVMASFCILLIARKMFRSFLVCLAMRKRIANAASAVSEDIERQSSGGSSLANGASTWNDVLPLFSAWWVVSLASHALQIAATLLCCSPNPTDLDMRFIFLGWGCFLTWVNICQYFQFFPAYYRTFSATQKGMASVCKYMISVLPIFTGFMFLGMCLFWKCSGFASPTVAYASLFSILNGDSIHQTFSDVGQVSGWQGHVFLYVFICIFIYIILNVNITIVQESFRSTRNDVPSYGDEEWIHDCQESQSLQRSTFSNPDLEALAEGGESAPHKRFGTPQRTPPRPRSSYKARNAESDRFAGLESSSQANDVQVGSPMESNWDRSLSAPLARDTSMQRRSRLDSWDGMSSRFAQNPRLQRTLAVAFPEALQERQDVGPPRSGRRSTWGAASRASSSDSIASTNRVSLRHSLGDGPVRAHRGSVQGQQGWWLTALPALTQTLRAMPIPQREDFEDVAAWTEFANALSQHSIAIGDVIKCVASSGAGATDAQARNASEGHKCVA